MGFVHEVKKKIVFAHMHASYQGQLENSEIKMEFKRTVHGDEHHDFWQ